MEKRLLVFFAVTFVLVSLWSRLFPPPEVLEPGTSSSSAAEAGEMPADVVGSKPVAPAAEPVEAAHEAGTPTPVRRVEGADVTQATAAATERTIVVETPLYRLVLSNAGARIRSMRLSEHMDNDGLAYEMVGQTANEVLKISPLALELEDPVQNAAVGEALFVTDAPEGLVLRSGEQKTVELNWSDGRGLEVRKTLSFSGSTYRVASDISVKVHGAEVPKGVVVGAGIGNEVTQSRYVGADRGVVMSGSEVSLMSADDIREGEGRAISVRATGVASHYFAALMLPVDDGMYGSRLEVAKIPTEDEKRTERDVISAVLEAPQSPAVFTLYMGPKKLELLEGVAVGLGQIIDFGSWLRAPALLLRKALLWIYGFVGNFGWAIVLLTVLISVVLFPLKHYSFISMRRMQKIAPQTQKIRDRYKKVKPTDPRYQEMNQEIMALHKEHGVNPLSGCLPMILMLPFFFAFYRLLMASIELRHAPFVLWIQDLSVHDPMFVLPVLMGATQLAIQRMTPQTTADPVQAKIMSFMPVMFTFILAWAPSGLVLYWFTSNLVSGGQQVATNKLMKESPSKPPESEKGKKRKNKKSGKVS